MNEIKIGNVSLNLDVVKEMTEKVFSEHPQIQGLFNKGKDELILIYREIFPNKKVEKPSVQIPDEGLKVD